jgi:hypothetical protein
MGVGGDRLVGPAVDVMVGDMVGIEADVHRLALEALALQPGEDHVLLGGAVAIGAVDLRHHPAARVEAGLGGDDVVEAEAAGDRRRVEAVGGGRHHQPPAGGAVGGDGLARAGHDVARDLPVGEALDHRLEPLRRDAAADQQAVVDLLQPSAVDQLRHIGEHRQEDDRHQDQPPGREGERGVDQERGVGRPPGDRPVHVVDGEQCLHETREASAPRLVQLPARMN